MSDIWYYAEGDRSVGPLTLHELKAILSGISEAKNILVWQNTFTSWVRAENVPELAVLVIKPPVLPSSPPSVPSLPPMLPRDRLIPPINAQPSGRKGAKAVGYLATAAVIAIATIGVRFLAPSTDATSSMHGSSIISGKTRDSFVAAGMVTCLKKQTNDPENKSLSLSKEMLEKYCTCYMNTLADEVTNKELIETPQDGSVPPTFQKKVSAADASCKGKFRRSLLGG
jgi:hypothetical protein